MSINKIITKILLIFFGLMVFAIIIGTINKVFFNHNHTNSPLDKEFTLEVMDDATITGDEEDITVKLIAIKDERCDDIDNCTKTNERIAKVLVLNSHHISYIKLGELSSPVYEITKNKMQYTIELVSMEDDKVTLKLSK